MWRYPRYISLKNRIIVNIKIGLSKYEFVFQGILLHDKPYSPSTFFEEQLTAFEVWLAQGSEDRAPPEQLPIVLQVPDFFLCHCMPWHFYGILVQFIVPRNFPTKVYF